jgi:hypothetical protein
LSMGPPERPRRRGKCRRAAVRGIRPAFAGDAQVRRAPHGSVRSGGPGDLRMTAPRSGVAEGSGPPTLPPFAATLQRATGLKVWLGLPISALRRSTEFPGSAARSGRAPTRDRFPEKAIDGRTCPPYMAVHRRGRVSAQPRCVSLNRQPVSRTYSGGRGVGSLTLSVKMKGHVGGGPGHRGLQGLGGSDKPSRSRCLVTYPQ